MLAARLGTGRQSDWDDVSSGVWLDSESGSRPVALQEQAFRLHGGWLMTLLVHPGDDEDDEDDFGFPDAFDVWENPRFPSAGRRRK